MPVKHLKKLTNFTAKMHPHHVHIVCGGTVSATVLTGFVMHSLNPWVEVLSFTVAGVVAAWQRDIELRMIKTLRRVSENIKDDVERIEEKI